jgi:Tol biopolymer transport system component
LIDSDTSSMRVLLTVDSQWSWHYIFSPDGTKIAVSFPEGMDIYDASGVKLDRPVLAYPFINTASEYAWVASPAWSADSTTLVAVVPPQEPWTIPYDDSSVYRLSADGMTGELLFNTQMTYWPSEIAAISPDLAKLAFLVHSGAPIDGEFTLRLANIDGSGITDYTTGKIYAVPSWSTDSSKFYYRNDDSGAWIGQAGLAPISIPDFNNTPNVTWIDPNRFIGASGPEGGWKLLLGTVGSPTGVIYAASMDGDGIQFTVNR